MSNKHVNHQHGLHTMNETRPKTKLRKRRNKANLKSRKAELLNALHEARYGKKEVKPKTAKPARKKAAPKAEKKSGKKTAKKAAK